MNLVFPVRNAQLIYYEVKLLREKLDICTAFEYIQFLDHTT